MAPKCDLAFFFFSGGRASAGAILLVALAATGCHPPVTPSPTLAVNQRGLAQRLSFLTREPESQLEAPPPRSPPQGGWAGAPSDSVGPDVAPQDPVDQTPAPAEQTSVPADQASAPAEQTSVPAELGR